MKSFLIIAFLLAATVEGYRGYYKHHWKPRRVACDPVKCEDDCKETKDEKGCPKCICEEKKDFPVFEEAELARKAHPPIQCSVPKCPPGCKIQEKFEGPCPGCDCKEDIGPLKILKPKCEPMLCLENCKKFVDPDGCEVCDCPPMCDIPQCDPGCEIEKDPKGVCPGCICKDDIAKEDVPFKKGRRVKCAPPVYCPRHCKRLMKADGCPSCDCPPICDPPKCDPGCEIVKDLKGPCPICLCKEDIMDEEEKKEDLKPKCEAILCLPNCKKIVDPEGCPACDCPPICDIPKCDIGCEIEKKPGDLCPGCVCKEENVEDEIKKDMSTLEGKKLCPPLIYCSRFCKREMGLDGCPVCKCNARCSIPRCKHGCKLLKGSKEACPTCACEKDLPVEEELKKDAVVDIKDKRCPPPIFCGPSCKKDVDPDGCPTCECPPLCSIPKCDPGCEIGKIDPKDFCPGCICKKDILKGVAKQEDIPDFEKECHPVQCPPMCKKVDDMEGCPGCECPPKKCESPKCGYGCRVEDNKDLCPGCYCKRRNREWRVFTAPDGTLEMEVLKPTKKRFRQVKEPYIGGRMREKWVRIDD